MKRLKVIACEIAFRELCLCASQVNTVVDFTFMNKGLHDIGPEKMQDRLQKEIDQVDTEKYEAILLVYGLCSRGIVGLQSKLPLIIPKAHDCTTFFLGSKEKYTTFFREYSGAYIYTAGWLEREIEPEKMTDSIMSHMGLNKRYEEYVEAYGEENADYIMEILGGYEKVYDKVVFINTHVGDVETYRSKLQEKAISKKWTPIEIEGDTSLLFQLLNRDWNENDFLIVPPNHHVIATNENDIIGFKK